ncbi:MAG: polynucleotide adenylyltransferase/metal dependent phosphohydrolase, partial [Thermoleophilia bacterium]|nr:polynucleotide adenylyltransferase/metal dependent phosphohydrolase [Thermoleophilia bacterium]
MSEMRATDARVVAARARLAPLRAAIVEAIDRADSAQTWLVGGTVRDALLDRAVLDVDLATDASAEELAARLARAVRGTAFALGDGHGCWRVACPQAPADTRWSGIHQIDVCELRGATITDDLELRDFSANALAMPLTGDSDIIDVTGGLDDVRAGVVRMVSTRSLDDDPLRLVRAARFAHSLGWTIDADTRVAIRERAQRISEPAGERLWVELRALLLAGEAR